MSSVSVQDKSSECSLIDIWRGFAILFHILCPLISPYSQLAIQFWRFDRIQYLKRLQRQVLDSIVWYFSIQVNRSFLLHSSEDYSVTDNPIIIVLLLRRHCPTRNSASRCGWFLRSSRELLGIEISKSGKNHLECFISVGFRQIVLLSSFSPQKRMF